MWYAFHAGDLLVDKSIRCIACVGVLDMSASDGYPAAREFHLIEGENARGGSVEPPRFLMKGAIDCTFCAFPVGSTIASASQGFVRVSQRGIRLCGRRIEEDRRYS